MSNGKSKRRLLVKGMEGEDVRDVQRKLNARRISEKKLAEDGKFGDETDKAVREFQRRNNLGVDGKVGDRTWDAVNTMLAVVAVEAKPGPQFRPLLDRMIDEAEQALNRPQGGISPAWERRFIDRNTRGPYLTLGGDQSNTSTADRIYQFQGQFGRTLRPFRNWTRADGWDATRPDGYYNWGAVFALTWRTSQEDRHWEYGPLLQLQRNYADPRWSIQAGVSVLYADRWHLGRWHLGSFYTQPSLTVPWFNNHPTLTLPVGYQASFDLVKDGNCNIFVQGQVAASIDLNTREISIGSGVVLGATVNIPSDLSKLRWNFCSAW
jgi:peptidoglycan hydrolase-like protein with peptidoglycan-binding domain